MKLDHYVFLIPEHHRRVEHWCYENQISPRDSKLVVMASRNSNYAARGCPLGPEDRVIVLGNPSDLDDIFQDLRYRLTPAMAGRKIADIVEYQ